MNFGSISLAFQANCPSCGALVQFVSKSSIYAVCPFCKSMLLRKGMDLENLGKIAELQNDPSPFQIGTEGTYEKRAFTLIGRVQMKWEDGFWNEWHMYFNGDQSGWLAEAQGFIMVSFETDRFKNIPKADAILPESKITIQDKPFTVDDIKDATCNFFEGELPFKAIKGDKVKSIDLSGENDQFASISFMNGETQVYIGKYLELEQLKCKNLRSFDGWK